MQTELTGQALKEFCEVMGVSEEMIPLFPLLRSRTHTMNPWVRRLPGILRGLKLNRGLRVLDLACGEGGVSVPLARNYGVRVTGYDFFPSFVTEANRLAARREVEALCRYRVGDVRDVVKRERGYGLLLWIAAPKVFGSPRATVGTLRCCLRHGGLILIGDDYLRSYRSGKPYEGYEDLETATDAYTSWGDDLVRVIDYGARLWHEDYGRERKETEAALRRVAGTRAERILKAHLQRLALEERAAIRDFGAAIWIIGIKKQ